MSISQIACAIDATECAIVRLKPSGSDRYSLTECTTLPIGASDLASSKGERKLKKLTSRLKKWQAEDLALSVGPETYLPLPAYFPSEASREACREYCNIEARYFLNCPEEYNCDISGYTNGTCDKLHQKHLLLFYPAEPCRRATEQLSLYNPIVFSGTPQLPLQHLSRHSPERQVILELENSYMLLTVAHNGQLERFSCHQVKNREEAEYFTIRELMDNPVGRDTTVQCTGSKADKSMRALIAKATSLNLKPLELPESLPINNLNQFAPASGAAVKAISMALMALAEKEHPAVHAQ